MLEFLFGFIVSIVLTIFFTAMLLLLVTIVEVYLLKQGIFDLNRTTIMVVLDMFKNN